MKQKIVILIITLLGFLSKYATEKNKEARLEEAQKAFPGIEVTCLDDADCTKAFVENDCCHGCNYAVNKQTKQKLDEWGQTYCSRIDQSLCPTFECETIFPACASNTCV